MKKIIYLTVLTLSMMLCFTGCGRGNNNTESGTNSDNNSSMSTSNMNYSASDIINTVKAAYGNNYYPDTAMLEDRLNTEFPIDKSLVKEIKAEMPTIGENPDRLVAVVANEGKGDEVETALNNARDALISAAGTDSDTYAKLHTSRVVRNGDYVCYIMLGEEDNSEGVSQSTKIDHARAEVLKGVNAFESMFKTA